ncbi:protein FAM110A [Triplophysa dalaica]|uniref:protein FAM110A n=1 Tax=Triplophysa dalaica TaxID=1582913 RepID=UPI0024DF54FD|nr:protein FAM110A [Triplophysa dalaica]
MSIDTLQPSPRRFLKLAETSAVPSRNLESRCPVKSSPGTRKPSAVERLEADKVKYVKTQQVALKKQQPVTCPSNNSQTGPGAQQPTRKVPAPPTKSETPPLDLEHLCKLIDGVDDTTTTALSTQPIITVKVQEDADPCKPPSPTLNVSKEPLVVSSPTSQGKADALGANGCPVMTVRRVDVRPQLPQTRMAGRPQLQIRTPGQPTMPQVPMQLLRLLRPYTQQNQHHINLKRLQNITTASRGPIKPPSSPAQISPSSKSPSSPFNSQPSPIKPNTEPASCTSPTQMTPTSVPPLLHDFQSPPSPAITDRSSTSSRKRPSLTRSKSDVSDCFSRAGAEIERFFNYCGLNPSDLKELARPGSDIVSVSRLRSASAPTSERTAEGEEEEEEDTAKDERPAYGISVIERNARVIKWLYGMRQAKESPKVANM